LKVLKLGGSILGEYINLPNNLPKILNILYDEVAETNEDISNTKSYNANHNESQLQEIVQKIITSEEKFILVISAFKKLTRIIKTFTDSLNFDKKYSDDMLSYGEVFSCSTVEKFLLQKGIQAFSFHRFYHDKEFPIVTTSDFGNAEILNIDTEKIKYYFESNQILIIPGFIGKDLDGESTTLGFEGSDITAVEVSKSLNSEECVLYKDVGGIYSCNPLTTRNTIHYQNINYDQAEILGRFANLIHTKSVRIARGGNLTLTLKSPTENNLFTKICNDPEQQSSEHPFFFISSNYFSKSRSLEIFEINIVIENPTSLHKEKIHYYLNELVQNKNLTNVNPTKIDGSFNIFSASSNKLNQNMIMLIQDLHDMVKAIIIQE
jgi:aspartate kinase